MRRPLLAFAAVALVAFALGIFVALLLPAFRDGGDEAAPDKSGEHQEGFTPTVEPAQGDLINLEAVLELDTTSTDIDVDAGLSNAADVLRERIRQHAQVDPQMYRAGSNRLVVQWRSVRDLRPEEALVFLETGLLEVRELRRDEQGNVAILRDSAVVYVPPEEAAYEDAIWVPAVGIGGAGLDQVLTGRYITDAHMGTDSEKAPVVNLQFNEEGRHLLRQIEERLVGQPLAFFLDGEPIRDSEGAIVAPVVRFPTNEELTITGLPAQDARLLSDRLNSGALPVPLKVVQLLEITDVRKARQDCMNGTRWVVSFASQVGLDQLTGALDDFGLNYYLVEQSTTGEFIVYSRELHGAPQAPQTGPAPIGEREEIEEWLSNRFGGLVDRHGNLVDRFSQYSSVGCLD